MAHGNKYKNQDGDRGFRHWTKQKRRLHAATRLRQRYKVRDGTKLLPILEGHLIAGRCRLIEDHEWGRQTADVTHKARVYRLIWDPVERIIITALPL